MSIKFLSEIIPNFIFLIILKKILKENEENALLIIKILTDHIKTFRPAFASELTSFFIQWKNAYTEMLRHTANESMFLQKPFSTSKRTIEESVVEVSFKKIFQKII